MRRFCFLIVMTLSIVPVAKADEAVLPGGVHVTAAEIDPLSVLQRIGLEVRPSLQASLQEANGIIAQSTDAGTLVNFSRDKVKPRVLHKPQHYSRCEVGDFAAPSKVKPPLLAPLHEAHGAPRRSTVIGSAVDSSGAKIKQRSLHKLVHYSRTEVGDFDASAGGQ